MHKLRTLKNIASTAVVRDVLDRGCINTVRATRTMLAMVEVLLYYIDVIALIIRVEAMRDTIILNSGSSDRRVFLDTVHTRGPFIVL